MKQKVRITNKTRNNIYRLKIGTQILPAGTMNKEHKIH